LVIPYFDKTGKLSVTDDISEGGTYRFFEPKPYDKFADSKLEGCLGQFVKVENLFDKNNLYQCDQCTRDKFGKNSKQLLRTKALKRYLVLTAPNYLLINLKRFSQSGFAFSKNSKKVSFPSYLFMDDYMIHKVHFQDEETINKFLNAKTSDEWVPNYVYRLYGVVCHSGGMGGGHYVAYVSYDYEGKRYWLFMSDSFVD